MREKNLKKTEYIVSIGILLFAIYYLARVNFSLPYMVLDEIRSVSMSAADGVDYILLYGRPSTLISHLVNQFLSFESVSNLYLIPRFVAMLVLLLGLVLVFRLMNYGWSFSIGFGSVTILLHELDWQHNGLISFFGGYSLYLGTFFIAIYIHRIGCKGVLPWLSTLVFVMISYSSEFFVALSLSYILIDWILIKRGINWKNPFIFSLCAYLAFYFWAKAKATVVHSDHMSNYLLGAYQTYSFKEMLVSVSIYLAGAIPHVKIDTLNGPYLATLIFAVSLILMFFGVKPVVSLWGKAANTHYDTNVVSNRIMLSLVGTILLFLPPVLMSIQPLKVGWAIKNMSYHYAFSMYEWFGFMILIAAAVPSMNRCVIHFCKFRLLIIIVGISLSIISFVVNVDFLKTYSNSFEKWKILNKIASESDGDLRVDKDLFIHPYIVAYDHRLFSEYIKTVYAKKLIVCSMPGFDLSKEGTGHLGLVYDDKLKLSNFYPPESDGRWTHGDIAEIKFFGDYSKGSTIFLEVIDVFGENREKPIFFNVDGKVYESVLSPGSIISLPIYEDVNNPTVKIVVASSLTPASYKISNDNRQIGIKFKRVGIAVPHAILEDAFLKQVCSD